MSMPKPIRPLRGALDAVVAMPGSKSITNRALILAALSAGDCTLTGALFSDDSEHLRESLQSLGFGVQADPQEASVRIAGAAGRVPNPAAELFVGLSGTAARFLPALCSLGTGSYRVDGVPRMRERPLRGLLDVLQQQGATFEYHDQPGRMPFTLHAHGVAGGVVRLSGAETSQHVSAMLMIAPLAREAMEIQITGELVSAPFVAMTAKMMAAFGVAVDGDANAIPAVIRVASGQAYRRDRYAVEPDVSGASYFFAAAAVSGGRITLAGLTQDMLQGDLAFLDVLQQMGCEVAWRPDGVVLQGPPRLRGVDVDLRAISDMAPTLAAIAPFADGATDIAGIAHTRGQETDRITALVTELRRLGIRVQEREDGLHIEPGMPRPAIIETYGDHRIAMAFAITGLAAPGIEISDPGCVAKTFPDYFERLAQLTP
jgi:3-phosphoshikimate 1-carboxyvinyltransferase